MTNVERMARFIGAALPDARVEVDALPGGRAFINVRRPCQFIMVEYRPGRGFGISTASGNSAWSGLGDRPSQSFLGIAAAQRQLSHMFSSRPRAHAVHGSRA